MSARDGFVPIVVPTSSLPVANATPTDGQFLGPNGDSIPFVDPDGPFETTTTDPIVAGTTVRVTVGEVGIQVGDWVTLINGDKESEAREVIKAGANLVTVDLPFDISASGTTTVSTKRIKPKLSWVVAEGTTFGNLAWIPAKNTITGDVVVHSNVSNFKEAILEVQIGDASTGVGMARKTQKLATKSGLPCKKYKEQFEYEMDFAMTGPPGSLAGKSIQMIGIAHFHFRETCNIRGITVALGPRESDVFNIPS